MKKLILIGFVFILSNLVSSVTFSQDCISCTKTTNVEQPHQSFNINLADNYLETVQAAEKEFLKNHPEKAERNGNVLRLKLHSPQFIVYTNINRIRNDSLCNTYVLGYDNDLNAFHTTSICYEDIINNIISINGTEYEIGYETKFSPDPKKEFATVRCNEASNGNFIKVFDFSNDLKEEKIIMPQAYQTDSSVCWEKVEWINKDKILITVSETDTLKPHQVNLVRTQDGWKLISHYEKFQK